MSKYTYHLGLGSNLGDRLAQLRMAKELISKRIGPITAESSVYETQPWGYEDQPWFLNQVIIITSSKEPREVLRIAKSIEVEGGREKNELWQARHIDIDILLVGDKIIQENNLVIPHPQFHLRNFVLVPFLEISGQEVHPVLQKTIEELYLGSTDTGEVYIFNADEQDHTL